jgi:hypothetical protein
VPDEKTNLLIRCRDNRKLVTGKKLYETLADSPVLGEYSIPIYGDVRKEKIKRTAIVEVRAIPVSIQKPGSVKDEKLPASIDLYAVEVKEKEGSYNGKDALCWRILTTKKTETLEEAVSVIDKYKVRWYIEQLFRLLKKQGYQIESSQLESGWAIRKLFLLVLNTALRWMQLYLAYDVKESQPVTDVFNEGEIKCLKNIESKYLDKTQHTNNPFNQQKLSWASWIIARLGGWKGNIKQRKAGPIIIKRGLEKFQIMYEGWKLVHEYT